MPTAPATFLALLRFAGRTAIFLFGCVSLAVSEAPPADSLAGSDLVRRADLFSAKQQFDSAAICLEAARQLFDRQGRAESTLVCYNRLAYNNLLQARFQEAGYQLGMAESVTQGLRNQMGAEAIQTLYLKGYRCVYLDSLDAALFWLHNALRLTGTLSGDSQSLAANCHYMLALAYHRKGIVDSALISIRKDLDILRQEGGSRPREIALALTEMGDLKRTAGDPDSAVACIGEALDSLSSVGLGRTTYACAAHQRLGTALSASGKLQKAVAHFDSAATLARQLLGDAHVLTVSAYASLGEAYAELGEWARATSCLHLALAVLESQYGRRHSSIAGLYDRLAKNYLDQDSLPEARTSIEEAIALERSLFGEKRPYLGGMYETLALISQKQGKHREALASFDRADSVFAASGLSMRRQLSRLNIESSASFLALGLLDSAKSRLETALSMLDGGSSPSPGQLSEASRMLGRFYERKGDTTRALTFYDKAITLAKGDSARMTGDEPQFVQEYIQAGLAKATLLNRSSGSGGGRRGNDQRLARLCTGMIAAIEKARTYMREEESKMTFSRFALPFCEIGIEACLRLNAANQSRGYLDTAFAFAEYGKARVLMESLEKEAALRVAGVTGSALQRERSLMEEVASANVLLKRAQMGSIVPDETVLRGWESRRLGALQDLSHLQDSLLLALPGVRFLTGAADAVPIRELQAALSRNTCLVEYFLGRSAVYVFLLHPEGIEAVNLGKPDNLEQLVAGYLESIRTVKPPKYLQSARALYRRLFSPLEPYLRTTKRLILVPDWSLSAVPFEALLTRPAHHPPVDEEIDFSRLPYLVRRFDVSYAYSGSFLLHARQSQAAPGLVDGLVGFAPVFAENGPRPAQGRSESVALTSNQKDGSLLDAYRLSPLGNSDRELRSIAEMFRGAGRAAKLFLGKAATKVNFKTACSAYAYVHVATHGILDPVTPKLSALLFADSSDGTARDDGLLYGEEAYNLSMGARLVTLSSCESGAGKIARGEGLLALTRGFFYAGAGNVLSSLWKVPDESTKDLMLDFYRYVLRGMSFTQSIRRAKLNLIGSPSTAYPREWAGFILIGA